MKEFYKAHFRDGDKDFIVVCYGWYKQEELEGTVYPSVEGAIEAYSENCLFVGLV